MTATSTGIFVDQNTLNMFTPKLKADLLEALFRSTSLATVIATSPSSEGSLSSSLEVVGSSIKSDEDIVDFTPALARRFVRGCSKKTTTALTAMVSNQDNEFKLSAVGKALSVPVSELTGVWAGITRRTRTVVGESKVYLIRWLPDQVYGPQGEYLDQTGAFSEMTYRSLRKVLLDS